MKKDATSSNHHHNSGWKGKKNDTSSSSKPTHTNHLNTCNISDVLALGQSPKKEFCKRREFTPIGMTYDAAYDRLHAQGLITPIGPIREPEPKDRSPNWDPNAYCKFHQGRGHSTERCWTLKNRIQDLIETSKLPLPRPERNLASTCPLFQMRWLSLLIKYALILQNSSPL